MQAINDFMAGELNYATAALFLRLIVAITMLPWGIIKIVDRKQKANDFYAVMGLSPVTSFYLAAFAETFAPICLIFGFFTRIAALGGVLNMGVAYLTDLRLPSHKKEPYYYDDSFPLLLGYIAIVLVGPGAYSLDYLMF